MGIVTDLHRWGTVEDAVPIILERYQFKEGHGCLLN
jgi:hypothetical protein